MSYWGERAKEGDSPLDYFGEFEDKGVSTNIFLTEQIQECKASDGEDFVSTGWYALFGCATLMIERGENVSPLILAQIYKQANKVQGGADRYGLWDKVFFRPLGNILPKR